MKGGVSRIEQAMGLAAGLGFVGVSAEWLPLVVILLGAILINPMVGWRYSTDPGQQRKIFAWLGMPVVLLTVLRLLKSQHTINTSIGLAVLGTVYVLACAVIEMYRRPEQARPEVYHMGLMTVMLVGGVSFQNRVYPIFLLLYFMLAVALLRHPFDGWWGRQGPAHPRSPWWGIVLAFLLAAPLAVTASLLLPNLGRLLGRLYSQSLMSNPMGDSRLFGATSDLNSVQRLEASRALVARVSGPNTVLRGQIYVTYEQGRWTAPVKAERRIELSIGDDHWARLPGPPPASASRWTIAPVKDVAGPVPAPSGAYRIRGIPRLTVDSYDGLIGDAIDPYTVEASDRCDERSPSCLSPRDAEYLQIPPELVAPLLEWSEPIVGRENPAQALHSYLAEHGVYDAKARRPADRDPILAFLQTGMRGHCEMFASAMALTLRARGIPTRYVVGFQLAEKNPWGNYYMVRDRDAHAWVEVYHQGNWVTFDPTPASQFDNTHPDGTSPSLVDGLTDALMGVFSATLSWLRRATLPGWLLLALTASPLLWLVVRRPQQLLSLFQRTPKAEDPQRRLLSQLETKLRSAGIQRRSEETVLELAARLKLELAPDSGQAFAGWLSRYAASRFGGQGETDELARELQSLPKPLKVDVRPSRPT